MFIINISTSKFYLGSQVILWLIMLTLFHHSQYGACPLGIQLIVMGLFTWQTVHRCRQHHQTQRGALLYHHEHDQWHYQPNLLCPATPIAYRCIVHHNRWLMWLRCKTLNNHNHQFLFIKHDNIVTADFHALFRHWQYRNAGWKRADAPIFLPETLVGRVVMRFNENRSMEIDS